MFGYTNPVASAPAILAHNYFDASDDYAAYEADQKGLQAVTAAFIAQPNFYVETFWLYSQPYEDAPGSWVLCESVDPMVDGSAVDIWTYNGRCMNRDPETRVFVRKDQLVAAGFEVPENTNPAYHAFREMMGAQNV